MGLIVFGTRIKTFLLIKHPILRKEEENRRKQGQIAHKKNQKNGGDSITTALTLIIYEGGHI